MSYFLCLLNLICTVLNSISDGNFLVLYRSVWAGQVCLLWEALRGKQVYQEQPVIAQCTNTLSLSLCSVVCPFVCVHIIFCPTNNNRFLCSQRVTGNTNNNIINYVLCSWLLFNALCSLLWYCAVSIFMAYLSSIIILLLCWESIDVKLCCQ